MSSSSRCHENAKAAMSEIETTSTIGNLSTVQLDVTDEKSIKEAAEYIQ